MALLTVMCPRNCLPSGDRQVADIPGRRQKGRVHRKLSIAVEPFSEWHPQARIFIDGKDWLGPEFSGLDPAMLKTELLDRAWALSWLGNAGAVRLGVAPSTLK